MLPFYCYSHLFGHKRNKGNDMYLSFVNEVVFVEYYNGSYEVYSVNRLLNLGENFAALPMKADIEQLLPNHKASPRRRQQA
jgi:hypothetical protein